MSLAYHREISCSGSLSGVGMQNSGILESSKIKQVLKGQHPIKIHRVVKKMVLISLIF